MGRGWNGPLARVMIALMCVGCATLKEGDSGNVRLFKPVVDGLDVSINGIVDGLTGPMQWDWGDGAVTQSWFPAQHTYAKAGSYLVRVQGESQREGRAFPIAPTVRIKILKQAVAHEQLDNPHRLKLLPPDVHGRTVTVNGVVVAPVKTIRWNWGDGAIDPHHWFPATHTYAQAGQYFVQVVTTDDKGRVSTQGVRVSVQ